MTTITYNVYSFDGYQHPPGKERGHPAESSPQQHADAVAHALRRYDPEYTVWAQTGLVDSYKEAGNPSHGGGTLLRPQPCARLDYVFVSESMNRRRVEARPLFEDDFRLYAEYANAVALNDHLPQLARFTA